MERKLLFCLMAAVCAGCKNGVVGASFGANAPTISSLTPTSATIGAPAFSLTVSGSNFGSGSAVRWNGQNRPTILVSASQLMAQISASDVSAQASVPVTVSNPDGSISNAIDFVVGNSPVPTVGSIAPSFATAGGPAFTLSVAGTNYLSGSAVQWNGSNRATHFISNQKLNADIPASDIASSGSAQVSVANPPPGGGSSNAATFTINPPGPVPVSLMNFMFNPHDITVPAGHGVTFTNNDAGVQHTVSKDIQTLPGPDEPLLNPGQSYTFIVPKSTASGTNIFYHCNFHGAAGNGSTFGPGMSGVIRVQ